jgi:hypothetical protein
VVRGATHFRDRYTSNTSSRTKDKVHIRMMMVVMLVSRL